MSLQRPHLDSTLNYVIAVSDHYTAECLRIHVSHRYPNYKMVAHLEDGISVSKYDKFNEVGLIISDVMLADGSAIDIFKECNINIPIIFFGAYEPIHYPTEGLNVAAFLLKPPAREEIERALERLQKHSDELISIKEII